MANELPSIPALERASELPTVSQEQYLDELLTEVQAAAEYKLTPRAFQNWRLLGKGPRFVRISSRAIRYRRRDLIAFAQERLRNSTSDTGAA